jgi:hypothetical protein
MAFLSQPSLFKDDREQRETGSNNYATSGAAALAFFSGAAVFACFAIALFGK